MPLVLLHLSYNPYPQDVTGDDEEEEDHETPTIPDFDPWKEQDVVVGGVIFLNVAVTLLEGGLDWLGEVEDHDCEVCYAAEAIKAIRAGALCWDY